VHQQNAPVLIFPNEYDADPMNPDAVHAGEDGIFPEGDGDHYVFRILNRFVAFFLA
jgi:hypothetical protein